MVNESATNDFLTLILMRHAKSDWDDDSLSDHDRPLSKRGRRDSPRMANWFAQIDCIPDLILSSSAQRTRETAALMCDVWDCEVNVSYSESLYLASPEAMMHTIAQDGGDARRLLVLAHNNGMSNLTSVLANQSIQMPTAAVAIFHIKAVDWRSLGSSAEYTLVEYMRPKALEIP